MEHQDWFETVAASEQIDEVHRPAAGQEEHVADPRVGHRLEDIVGELHAVSAARSQ